MSVMHVKDAAGHWLFCLAVRVPAPAIRHCPPHYSHRLMLHFLNARLQRVQHLHDVQICRHQNLTPDCHFHLHNHDRSEHNMAAFSQQIIRNI